MDVVEWLAVEPFIFCVVDFEVTVGWDTGRVRMDRKWNTESRRARYYDGWIGLRSLPVT